MLGHPEFGERLNRHFPEAKLIAILRNPIDRALSAYTQHKTMRTIPNHPAEWFFDRILQGPIGRVSEGVTRPRARALRAKPQEGGTVLPTDRIFLLTLDEVRADNLGALRRTYRFLGVDEDYQPTGARRQPMRAPYSPILAGTGVCSRGCCTR